MSRMQDVADAVVGLLETGEAAGEFSRSIYTTREWDATKPLEDLDEITVQVVPVGSIRRMVSNGTWVRQIRVDVLVRKKPPQSSITDGVIDRDWIDAHVAILEDIDDWLADKDNIDLSGPGAHYVHPTDKTVETAFKAKLGLEWVPEALINLEFFGVVRVAYEIEVDD